MMKKKRLSFLAMVLCLVLCVGLFPISASAVCDTINPSDRELFTLQIIKQITQDVDANETLIAEDDAFSQMQFTLYANEDILSTKDGSFIAKKGEIAKVYDPISGDYTLEGIISAHNNGVFTLENIPVGQYSLKETIVPDGIVVPEEGTSVRYRTVEDGEHSLLELSITNHTIKTKFHNTDVSGATMLAGSGLAVYKKDGSAFTRKDTSALAWTSSD